MNLFTISFPLFFERKPRILVISFKHPHRKIDSDIIDRQAELASFAYNLNTSYSKIFVFSSMSRPIRSYLLSHHVVNQKRRSARKFWQNCMLPVPVLVSKDPKELIIKQNCSKTEMGRIRSDCKQIRQLGWRERQCKMLALACRCASVEGRSKIN